MRTPWPILAASAALAAAACAAQPAPAPAPRYSRLPPPKIAGAAIRVTAMDAGKTIAAPVGAVLSVELVGVPTAGYLWAPVRLPDFLSKAGETSGPTTAAQRQPGFTGGNHWEVMAFRVDRAGKGELRFEQRRPWETNQPADDTFSVTIEAK